MLPLDGAVIAKSIMPRRNGIPVERNLFNAFPAVPAADGFAATQSIHLTFPSGSCCLPLPRTVFWVGLVLHSFRFIFVRLGFASLLSFARIIWFFPGPPLHAHIVVSLPGPHAHSLSHFGLISISHCWLIYLEHSGLCCCCSISLRFTRTHFRSYHSFPARCF